MRLEKTRNCHGMTVNSVIYDDIYGVSEYFLPKIWIDFWSKDRRFFLKTALGEKIPVTERELRQLNLKMTLQNVGEVTRPLYKRFLTVNSPRRAAKRVPLLSISKKLNKIWRGCINVEREYEKRHEFGYRGWRCEELDD